ncbi:hypothetical protein BC826DRAFT_224604 [Russula brevipes]|nr:hypothetical protein BC826DRAFT_224604 [Russula brevipes]
MNRPTIPFHVWGICLDKRPSVTVLAGLNQSATKNQVTNRVPSITRRAETATTATNRPSAPPAARMHRSCTRHVGEHERQGARRANQGSPQRSASRRARRRSGWFASHAPSTKKHVIREPAHRHDDSPLLRGDALRRYVAVLVVLWEGVVRGFGRWCDGSGSGRGEGSPLPPSRRMDARVK